MRLHIGIREKFAAVAIVLVVVCAVILYTRLFDRTTKIVVDHELVDLQDEGDLRCWENVNAVSRLRNEVMVSAADPERVELMVTTLKSKPKSSYQQPAEETEGWWEDILAVREVNLADKRETELFTAEGIIPPPIPENLTNAEYASTVNRQPRPLVSTILPLDVPVGFLATGEVPAAGSSRAKERVPVMWGFCRMTENPDRALAILLPLAGGASSRHLTFIIDGEGNFLQHPIIEAEPEGKPAAIYEKLDLFKAALDIAKKKRFAGETLGRQVQRGLLFEGEELSSEISYFYMEGTASAELKTAIEQAEIDRSGASEEEAEESKKEDKERSLKISKKLSSLDVRFGAPSKNSGAVRFLGHSETAIAEARDFIEEVYGERYGESAVIHWPNPVRHTRGDVYLARFYLRLIPAERPGGDGTPDPPYYFCSAVFREELAFSVRTEFKMLMREGIILAIISGVVAFLVALFFVRPLRAIAKAAQRVTVKEGDSNKDDDSNQLQHRIAKVLESLPIHKRDEVGHIARSLESLLRQVLNGHERLRQLNADLDGKVGEKTAELREANEELRSLAAAKDEFLASVSHELRQPLNSIFGYLQFLEMSDLDEEQRGDVGKTHMAAKYLHRLINDILDYQKIIMGGMELEPADFDADEFFNHMIESMAPQAAERGNNLVFEPDGPLGTLKNDRSRLQQILVNLISNACKFTGDGTVTVSVSRDGSGKSERILIRVKDTGRGMKPHEMEQLFVKFKKLAAREGNKTGTGLGLVICKGLAELMGGNITCVSEFGNGTTFTVDIPVAVEGGVEMEGTQGLPAPAKESEKNRIPDAPAGVDNSLVLVVDDDTTVCELIKRFLEEHGYDVITANDGKTGIEMARERQPAVITLDVVLPDQNGWEVLSELKSDPVTSDIPVLMLTFMEEKKRGYSLGADDYLVKPVNWEDFSRRIRRVLVKGTEAAPVLVVDDSADTRALFRRTLEKDKLTVIEAENGQEALEKLEEVRPAVIILDLMMPVMDGFEFIDRLRKKEEWQDIPVLVVTAKSTTPEDRLRLEGGVRAILNKGGSEQMNLLDDILSLVHRHSPKDSLSDG